MPELPPHLVSDNFGQESSEQRFAPRTLTMEEGLSRQIDRIAYLRSVGHDWAEALYQLRDMVVGLEDAEFWDGLPDEERGRVKELEKKGPKERKEAARIREQWEEEGWNGYPCNAVPGPGGRPIYVPSSENLSCAFRIIMRLLSRKGIAWRTVRVSRLKEWGAEQEEQAPEPEGGVPE